MKSNKHFVVGLTGGIASGKSEVTRLFADLKVGIVDADVIAREIVAPQQTALNEIVALFGQQMLLKNGELNRKKLRDLIFKHKKARLQLNAIMHPKIRARMWQQVEQQSSLYCICSVPLLVETAQIERFNRILVIDCDIKHQKQRLIQRDNINESQAKQMLNSQCQAQQRLLMADDILTNNGSINDLTEQVSRLHTVYLNKVTLMDGSEK